MIWTEIAQIHQTVEIVYALYKDITRKWIQYVHFESMGIQDGARKFDGHTADFVGQTSYRSHR